jgi:hypothetical protein
MANSNRQSDRQAAGETAPKMVTYYAPDGGEYPVNEDTLSAVERTQLRAWGYSTEKPDAAEAEAAGTPIPDGGPLSGAADAPA